MRLSCLAASIAHLTNSVVSCNQNYPSSPMHCLWKEKSLNVSIFTIGQMGAVQITRRSGKGTFVDCHTCCIHFKQDRDSAVRSSVLIPERD